MSEEQILRSHEDNAAETPTGGDSYTVNVTGRESSSSGKKKSKSKIASKSLFSTGAIVVVMVLAMVFLSTGEIMPAHIAANIQESANIQRTDEIKSKQIVFQAAMRNGDIPDNTTEILKEHYIIVGCQASGGFVETNKDCAPLVLKMLDNKTGEPDVGGAGTIVTADGFLTEISKNVELYEAFNDATYAGSDYYYDDAAEDVFDRIGVSRDDEATDDFEEMMNNEIGEGSNISMNTLKDATDGTDGGISGTNVNSSGSSAQTIVHSTVDKNTGSVTEGNNVKVMNSADMLDVADTTSEEQISAKLYVKVMSGINKMKAGEGNDSNINDYMNYLYTSAESTVVDVNTCQEVTVTGTPLESASLYALVTKGQTSGNVDNYKSGRIVQTARNLTSTDADSGLTDTVASTDSGVKGTIGKMSWWGTPANQDALDCVIPTIDSSMVNNSFSTMKGIRGGELIAKGAVTTEAWLGAASGASEGDAQATQEYSMLNNEILAMDAAVDRLHRSPFDITSKNTFLGSIIYKFAMAGLKFSGSSLFTSIKTFSSTVSNATLSLLPTSYADETNAYLTSYGDCERYNSIGAVATDLCARDLSFDTSTYGDILSDPTYLSIINKYTTESNGNRKINTSMDGDNEIEYYVWHNQSITTPGVIDGGIYEAIKGEKSSVGFIASIQELLDLLLGKDEKAAKRATGEQYVNTSSNGWWNDEGKYIQRYIALDRAKASMQRFAVNYDGRVAYGDIETLEGEGSSVMAYLREYRSKDTEIAEDTSKIADNQ